MSNAGAWDKNLTALVGNGLSIGFNPDLKLASITQEMLDRIGTDNTGGAEGVAAMRAAAERALPQGATSDRDFEVLIGAFEATGKALGDLRDLARLARPNDKALRKAIGRAAAFAEEVHDLGVSHIAEVIFERSRAHESAMSKLREFVESLTDAFEGDVVFGNLNYDTLLLAALLAECKPDLADIGDGRMPVEVKLNGGENFMASGLRKSRSDFPSSRRIQLLHLHGSLTYWEDTKNSIFAKLSMQDLEDHDFFERVRLDDTEFRPAIVLANQRGKADQVLRHPFKLAYEMWELGLTLSSRWLIVGYSFRDTVVNDVLLRVHDELKEKPKVLVVTLGEIPTEFRVKRAFGYNRDEDASDWLTIYRGGAENLVASKQWQDFSS